MDKTKIDELSTRRWSHKCIDIEGDLTFFGPMQNEYSLHKGTHHRCPDGIDHTETINDDHNRRTTDEVQLGLISSSTTFNEVISNDVNKSTSAASGAIYTWRRDCIKTNRIVQMDGLWSCIVEAML